MFIQSSTRLNSRDSFVVRNTSSQMQYVWYGKALGQDMDKITLADELANNMNEFDETRGIVSVVVVPKEGFIDTVPVGNQTRRQNPGRRRTGRVLGSD